MEKHSRSRIEMASSLVSQEVPLEDMDEGTVVNPLYRGGGADGGAASPEDPPQPPSGPRKRQKHGASALESMDFEEVESRQWRKVMH
jgi:hypothetical protein